MLQPKPTVDLLAFREMPEAAAALRERTPTIITRWTEAVERHLPDAEPLTVKQVRDSIPAVLEKIAAALESGQSDQVEKLTEIGTAHGVARFQQNYKIDELLVEYRLLRRIVFEELQEACSGKLTLVEAIAVDMAIDTALQRGVVTFVQFLTTELKAAASSELKYVSFLSHDLRNNLNSVMLSLDWLTRRLSGSPEFEQDAADLASLQQAMSETIEGMDRLLQAERLRRRAVELKLRPVKLHQLAADLLGQAIRKATEKGLVLENAVPVEAAAHSDRELISLALQNLLGNAIKFSTKGRIRLEARESGMGWRVAVSDEGPGIEPGRLKGLFEAFTRGESHGQPGVGLGLSIASHAARLLGSELRIDSTVGKGSTFSFDLPPAKPSVAE